MVDISQYALHVDGHAGAGYLLAVTVHCGLLGQVHTVKVHIAELGLHRTASKKEHISTTDETLARWPR